MPVYRTHRRRKPGFLRRPGAIPSAANHAPCYLVDVVYEAPDGARHSATHRVQTRRSRPVASIPDPVTVAGVTYYPVHQAIRRVATFGPEAR